VALASSVRQEMDPRTIVIQIDRERLQISYRWHYVARANEPMKAAIFLTDGLSHEADLPATRMHVNRSQLHTVSLSEFTKEHREGEIATRVNKHIQNDGQAIDPVFLGANHRDMREVEWGCNAVTSAGPISEIPPILSGDFSVQYW
jgi:hypothetical protein